MSTATTKPTADEGAGDVDRPEHVDRPGSGLAVAGVRVPVRTLNSELRAIKIVMHRELIRFFSDRLRMVTALVQPFLFLFVLGSGLSRLTSASTGGLDLKTFLYPGILGMSVLFTAMFSAASIVWDREFGFLREMLVAPVRRSSIVIGKCLGGAAVASFQGVIVIAIAGLVGVPYAPLLIIEVFGMQLLLAFTITSFGVMVAARVRQMQSFMALTQMLVLPLYFLSGAMFPASNLPTWLAVLNRIDPLTYAVDPIRRVVFDHLTISPAVRARLDPGITWDGWRVPTLLEVGVIAALGLLMLGIAIAEFSKTE
jgi:ABC-2 type transport system permease protein